jgi:ketosteroid isomerase-like protein
VSETNVEIVKRTYDAVNDAYGTGDYSKPVEEFCHADVVLRTSGMFPETGEYRGYEGLQEFTSNQAETFEECRCSSPSSSTSAIKW